MMKSNINALNFFRSKMQKLCRVYYWSAIITICALCCGITIYAQPTVSINKQEQSRSKRIYEILQEVKKYMPEDTKNRLATEEIYQRQISSFADFAKQCDDLHTLQTQTEMMEKRKRHMLTELQYEFRDDLNVQRLFYILFQMEDVADKLEPIQHGMIACSKILASKSKTMQEEYRTICVDPALQQMMLVEPDTKSLMSELQKEVQMHGETLPPDILQLIGH